MADIIQNQNGFAKVIKELFSALPLKKLSPNQIFDLAFDMLMLFLLVVAAFMDFGAHNAALKALLIFICLGLMAWSLRSNLES